MSQTHSQTFSFVDDISNVCGSVWTFFMDFPNRKAISDSCRSQNPGINMFFLVAKLLYKSKCPFVSMSVCMSGLGGNVIFSAPN